jgi:preprotein translocase subunit SecA
MYGVETISLTMVHEQKDPLLIYKFEALILFNSMLNGVNKEVISFLFKGIYANKVPQTLKKQKEVVRKRGW